MTTRRSFLGSSALLAADLFGAPKESAGPSPKLEALGAVALREARKHQASYCDIRINRYRNQSECGSRRSAAPARRSKCRP